MTTITISGTKYEVEISQTTKTKVELFDENGDSISMFIENTGNHEDAGDFMSDFAGQVRKLAEAAVLKKE